MIETNWVLLFLSFMASFFVFLCFFNIRDIKAKSLIKRIENYTEKFSWNAHKDRRSSDLKLYLEGRGSTKILGCNIESITGLLILRIVLSITALIIFFILGFFVERNYFVLSFILALILLFLPVEICKSKINRIGKRILNEIPESLDILSSLIKAGLSLDQAIEYYSDNYKGEISQLFKIARSRVYEGKSREDAYFSIAELSFCNEFKTVIKIIIQSDLIGNPINKVLKDLSKTMRINQRDQIKIKAERLESSLMLIIFVFMFIPMMLLFLLPVIPQLKIIFN